MNTYKEVTKTQFFAHIMSIHNKNIHPKIEGNYPYSSDFLDTAGESHGKIVPLDQEDAHAGNKYLLPV